jgi:outer membrane immunogenic protein
VSDWGGFYAGINGGYALSTREGCYDLFNIDSIDCDDGGTTPFEYDLSGGFFGAQAGFDFQLNDNFVVGVQVDGSVADISGDLDGLGTGTYSWLASATAKLGYTTGDFMLYVKGGVATGGFSFAGTFGCDFDQTLTGGTAGIGAEMRMADNISVFAEYDRTWFPDASASCTTLGFIPTSINNKGTVDQFKVGLNYRF